MRLDAARAGAYTRAVSAALDTLAPHDDFVPLVEVLGLLRVLDPACSGDLLGPFEVHDRSGLPSLAWHGRALAEIALSTQARPTVPSPAATRRDPALAERMARRTATRAYLSSHPILPRHRVGAILRSNRPLWVTLQHDALDAHGHWTRTRVDLRRPARGLRVDADGSVHVHHALARVLSRHALTPLSGLGLATAHAADGQLTRASRSVVGPVWFDGIELPAGVPVEAGTGLAVHLASEIIGADLYDTGSTDPLHPAPPTPPPGMGSFADRRIAATPAAMAALETWTARVGSCTLVPLR